MKHAVLNVSDIFVVQICQGLKVGMSRKFRVIKNPLPNDAKPVHIITTNTGTVGIVLESETFKEISFGMKYPELPSPVLEVIQDTIENLKE